MKCEEIVKGLFVVRKCEKEKEKESRKGVRRPKARQTLGNLGKWLFILSLLGAKLAV